MMIVRYLLITALSFGGVAYLAEADHGYLAVLVLALWFLFVSVSSRAGFGLSEGSVPSSEQSESVYGLNSNGEADSVVRVQ
jgi:hypothetical protein